jgi:hypothetical protein
MLINLHQYQPNVMAAWHGQWLAVALKASIMWRGVCGISLNLK